MYSCRPLHRQKHSHCWPANYCCIVDLFPSAAPCCNVGTQKSSRINAAFCFAFCSSCRSLRAMNCRAKHWIFVAWAVCQGRAVSRMQSPKLVSMLTAGRLQLLFLLLPLPACKIHWAVTPACLPYSSSTSCACAHERFSQRCFLFSAVLYLSLLYYHVLIMLVVMDSFSYLPN